MGEILPSAISTDRLVPDSRLLLSYLHVPSSFHEKEII